MSVSDISVRVGMDATRLSAGAKRVAVDVKGIEQSMRPTNMSLRQMRREATAVFMATRTPLENYRRELEKLSLMHQKGVITQDTHARAVRRAKQAYDTARMSATTYGRAMLGLRSGIGQMAGMLGLSAVGYRTVQVLKDQFKELDNLAKTSRIVGTSAQGLLELRHAATLSGVATTRLDKGLFRMARNIGEVTTGIGEAKEAFEDLNLDARELAKMSGEQQFIRIAEAIANLSTEAEQAHYAAEIFGRSGPELLNLIREGGPGIEATGKRLRELRGELSDFDANKIEEANDRLSDLWQTLKGIAAQKAIDLAPWIEGFAKLSMEAGKSDTIVRAFLDSLDPIKQINKGLDEAGVFDWLGIGQGQKHKRPDRSGTLGEELDEAEKAARAWKPGEDLLYEINQGANKMKRRLDEQAEEHKAAKDAELAEEKRFLDEMFKMDQDREKQRLAAASRITAGLVTEAERRAAHLAEIDDLVGGGYLSKEDADAARAKINKQRLQDIAPTLDAGPGQIEASTLAASKLKAQHERFMRGGAAAGIQAEQARRFRQMTAQGVQRMAGLLEQFLAQLNPFGRDEETVEHIHLGG